MTSRKRPTSHRYTDAQRKRALELLVSDGLPAAAQSVPTNKTTIRRWAAKAGIGPDRYGETSRNAMNKTAAASRERHQLRIHRDEEWSDHLHEHLSTRAVALIVARLDEEEEQRLVVNVYRQRWRDALTLEVQARDLGPKAEVEAKEHATECRLDLELARAGRMSVRDLVGIATRSVHDRMQLLGRTASAAAELPEEPLATSPIETLTEYLASVRAHHEANPSRAT